MVENACAGVWDAGWRRGNLFLQPARRWRIKFRAQGGKQHMLTIDQQGMVIQDARIIARRAKGVERSQIYRVCGVVVY